MFVKIGDLNQASTCLSYRCHTHRTNNLWIIRNPQYFSVFARKQKVGRDSSKEVKVSTDQESILKKVRDSLIFSNLNKSLFSTFSTSVALRAKNVARFKHHRNNLSIYTIFQFLNNFDLRMQNGLTNCFEIKTSVYDNNADFQQ